MRGKKFSIYETIKILLTLLTVTEQVITLTVSIRTARTDPIIRSTFHFKTVPDLRIFGPRMFKSKAFIPSFNSVRTVYGTSRIGNRDVVGHGVNGCANYKDDAHFPFPAIRFQENSRYITALRLKEKGDWKQLCCEEKKALYRASFCQTFAEFQHPTGSWKFILGWALFISSGAFWIKMFHHFYVNEPLPEHLSYENQKLQLRRILELRMNAVDGISTLWDYDEDNWKALVPGMIKKEVEGT